MSRKLGLGKHITDGVLPVNDDLIRVLASAFNQASERLSDMHQAVLKLISELTADERAKWKKIEARAKEHSKRMKKAYFNVGPLRKKNPRIYFERTAAVIERDTDEIKAITKDIMALIEHHYSQG